MKKLLTLLSAILLFSGCGGPSNNSSPPTQPKITASTSSNNDGTTNVSWSSNDPVITSVAIESAATHELLYTGGPIGSTTVRADVRSLTVVAYQAAIVVDTIIITLPVIPPPPPTFGDVTLTVSWTLPTTYADSTAIDPLDQANIVVALYCNTTGASLALSDIKLGESVNGALSMTVTAFRVNYNQLYYFGVRCHIAPDGLWSDFSPPYSYSWPTP